ncbi:MAG TPA: Hsp20/alpha crystallin family protein [Longimicrobiales bacterium]
MKLTRYRAGFPEASWMRPMFSENRIQRLLADLMGPMQAAEGLAWSPEVDIVETDLEIVVRADLPGLAPDDVQLEVRDGMLVMKGEKKEEKEEKGAEYRVVERAYGSFERAFSLPSTVDADSIAAEFRNGVLEVHLPKTVKAQGRRVPIGKQK